MKFISTLEIETYSIENPRQAQELIPQLLRKLIIDTIPKEELEKCDIPSRDDIIISGLDGSVVLNEKNIYIGNGKICIEIGTNKNCLTKANKDFKKRNETEENKQDKTFVFVTPIRWDNPIMSKGKWVEKNKGEWKDIRIVDAEALQNWLESSILTTKWFSKIIGKNIDDIENIDDVNEYLLDQTIYKFDLSFFDYEDIEFRDEFEKCISLESEIIRIKSQTIEEARYYVLYILKQNEKLKDKVIIVETYEQWKNLLQNKVSNLILIPKFRRDGLEIICNNINILIYSIEDDIIKDYVELRERLKDNLVKKLYEKLNPELQPNPELNLDLDKINDILEKSLVRFSPLKRLIFKNDYAPNWVKGDKSLFIPMLLFKKFHTSDIPTIEKMVGNYSDYIKRIQDHINSGDPFALYTKENEMYSVINKYEAWDILYNKITNEDLIKFKKIAGEILKYDNPKFDLDDDKISFASIFLEGNPIYSETIRKSVVDTIILFKKFSRKNEYSNYNFFDDIVKEYYESIDCEKKWINFSEIAHYLVEYSPEMYLEKIEASINKDEFKSLFKVPNNILGSSGKYIKILWGLEKLLYIEDYVKETICIIAKLAEYEVDYKNHGNNPMNILKDAFIASDNTINISLLDRCKLLSHIVEKYKIGHALLSSVLPKYPNSWSHFVKPDYLTYDFKYKIIYIHEQIDNFNTYYEIYVDNFSDSLEHMSDLYSNIYFLKLEVGCKISKIIIELIKESDDISKYKLEKKVRKLLYGFYNYDNELWKLSELEKNHLEDIMKSITYTSDKYKYLYLFEKWSTYIISKIAKEDIEVEIYNLKREAILELKKSCSDMVEMCNEIPDDGPTSIAQYIYKYYHDNKYNIKFIIDMFNIKKIKILGEYITNVSQFEGIPAIIKIINCNEFKSVNIENKVVILKYSKITEELIMFINSNEEVAKLYWSTISLRVIPEDIFERIYENLLKHGNYIACLELISNKKGNIEKKIQLLEKIKSDEMTCYSMTEYYINRIFKSIYSYENKDKDRIINLEVHFMNLIDEEYKLKYFKNKLFSNSKILADLVKSAYISDNHIKKVLNNQEKIIAQNCYRIIEKISEIELNEEDMDIWVDSYFLLLKENNQISVGTSVLGSLLAKSKKDETDLIYPRKINRLIIEKYYSDELSKAFKTQEYNNRGVHTVDSGKGELKLSKQYEKWSNVLKPNYKKTAKILHEISERYKLDAIRERKESNYL